MMENINFGTVGFGAIARTHLAGMMASASLFSDVRGGPRIRAVPRVLVTRRVDECKNLPYEKVTASLDEMLNDGETRVVDVCTANHEHFASVAAATRAGKAIYCEKPLADNLDDALRMAEMASSVPNQCALILRFLPLVNRMKDYLESRALGTLCHFRVWYYHWSYQDADRPLSWRQDISVSGGGASIDLGIHILDLTRYLLGEVRRLSAVSRVMHPFRFTDSSRTKRAENRTDEYMSARLEMENGATGIFETSRVSNSACCNEGIEIFGTDGSLFYDFDAENLTYTPRGALARRCVSGPEGKAGPNEAALLSILPLARAERGAFFEAHAAAIYNVALLAAGKPSFLGAPTFREAARSQALVAACLESAAHDAAWVIPRF